MLAVFEVKRRFLLNPNLVEDQEQRWRIYMAITPDRVREIKIPQSDLRTATEVSSFTHVADDVDWIVEGTHPLRRSLPQQKRIFLAHTFENLQKSLAARHAAPS